MAEHENFSANKYEMFVFSYLFNRENFMLSGV